MGRVNKQDALSRLKTESTGDVNREVAKVKDREEEKKRVRKAAQHDALHDFETFTCCWCMCSRCWMRLSGGTGRCICSACPCRRGKTYLSPLTMTGLIQRRSRALSHQ